MNGLDINKPELGTLRITFEFFTLNSGIIFGSIVIIGVTDFMELLIYYGSIGVYDFSWARVEPQT